MEVNIKIRLQKEMHRNGHINKEERAREWRDQPGRNGER